MTRFERHIAARLIKGFVLFVGALIIFFIVLHWVEYSDDFLDRGATLQEVFLVYYPNYIPEIVRLTSPLALFLACIYHTGKLAQELQLTALQTSGVSLYRLMVPYLGVGLLVTVAMFGFNGWIVPKANETVVAYDNKYLNPSSSTVDVSEVHRQNGPNTIISVGYYDRRDNTGHRVSIQQFKNATQLEYRVDANRIVWVDSTETWQLHSVTRRWFDDTGMTREQEAGTADTTLHVFPRDFARTQRDVEAMTIPVAAEYLDALRRSGAGHLGRPLVAYYTKYAYPFANLIVVMIGVPLAAVRRRGGQASRFAIGLLTAFVYLALQKLAEPFGYAGTLPPAFAAWFPHVAFAAIAVIVLWRTRK
ncbi:permease [Longibacter salinarum]|uniref:Permease n=1 Tax=Longibacter salinarum TaxID=1850348 RepID=A0A2A8CZS7_9BACT|nr:permease [Longibacter salinarum]